MSFVAGASSAAFASTVDLYCKNDADTGEFHLLINFDQSTVTRPGVYTGVEAKITSTQVVWRYDTSSDGSDPEDCTLSRDSGKLRTNYQIRTSSGKYQGNGAKFATCTKAANVF
jgi:hypothetical protein